MKGVPETIRGIVSALNGWSPGTVQAALAANDRDGGQPAEDGQPELGCAGLYDPVSTADGGFYEGIYENADGYIPLQTANNDGIILAALLYKGQGPILRHLNKNTQFWDVAYSETDARQKKCLPTPMIQEVPCCECANIREQKPTVPIEAFKYCRPIPEETGIAATECRPEEHHLPLPEPGLVKPKSCRLPEAAQ